MCLSGRMAWEIRKEGRLIEGWNLKTQGRHLVDVLAIHAKMPW